MKWKGKSDSQQLQYETFDVKHIVYMKFQSDIPYRKGTMGHKLFFVLNSTKHDI